MAKCTNVVVTRVSDISDVLVKRLRASVTAGDKHFKHVFE